jgi:hypothetical protein
MTFYEKVKDKKEYDIIIFHEGNIILEHQEYIQKKTPNLPLIFREISFIQSLPKSCELCPETKISKKFGLGYKNMCYFWSYRFLDLLKEYEYIIRVDEDCILRSMDFFILDYYREMNIKFSSPFFQENDISEVIVGMDQLFTNYMIERKIVPNRRTIRCPYTNIMIVNIPYFRENKRVQEILERIIESGCIFNNRWGDLPIWGHILSYFIESKYYFEDKKIHYFHGSHKKLI